tara:strand:- start:61 stop:651 length:591 start_codon:yes stop_codon:yes gene_type:complete
MKLVALAGAIASGKSTALNLVKRKGFVCFDLDRYNRQLLESDREVSQLIKDRYGESSVVNNRINRERLRSIIYQKSEEKHWLESVMHPRIMTSLARDIAPYQETNEVLFVEIPLISQAMNQFNVDQVCVFECVSEKRVQRIIDRSGWSLGEITDIIDKQMSEQELRGYADILIFNESSLSDLSKTVDWLCDALVRD